MAMFGVFELLVIALLVMPMPSNALRGNIQGERVGEAVALAESRCCRAVVPLVPKSVCRQVSGGS
jgi:hypothetical protein